MIESFIMFGAVVGVIACLITESKILAKPRDWLGWDLLYCPICVGFWVALPFLWLGFASYFATVAFSNLWMLIILKVYKELDESSEDDAD